MANHALLNNVEHKDIKVVSELSEKYGDNIHCTLAFPFEFRNIQADFPIFFSKDSKSQKFQSLVMFGFEENENLYLSENEWSATYVPLMMERGPFLIGFQESSDTGDGQKQPVITIDLDNPRVNTEAGEPLFLPHGGNTDYTEKMASILHAIHEGHVEMEKLTNALEKYDLLEPFSIDIELNDGSKNRFTGFYTIHEENLAKLDASALSELSQLGFIQAIYMVVASMSNIRQLIDRKNEKISG